MTNVIPINSQKSKESKATILNDLRSFLHPEHICRVCPPLRSMTGHDYRIVKTSEGRYWVRVLDDHQLIVASDMEAVVSCALLSHISDLNSKDIRELILLALNTAELMDKEARASLSRKKKLGTEDRETQPILIKQEDIAPIRFKSDPGWCWKKLDFDPDVNADPGIWETELIPRITSNKKALLAWIGSLFDPTSDRERYVWLYGKGGSGKSTICEFLIRNLGISACAGVADEFESKWFTSTLVGKRLCVLEEARSKLVTSGAWKRVTGNTYHNVEEKYKVPIKVKLDTKFIVASNEMPELKFGNEHRRRIILVETKKPDDWIISRKVQKTNELLDESASYFFGLCFEEYKRQGFNIEIDYEEVDELQEDDPHIIMMDMFSLNKEHWISHKQLRNIFPDKSEYDLKMFIKFIKKNYGIEPIRRRNGNGVQERGYQGLIKNI